jgi:2,3,4,5-tetrahydropyridine-2-carboxylate N-succinyltransferase
MTESSDLADLRGAIEALAGQSPLQDRNAARAAVARLLRALERGEIRAAKRGPEGWEAVRWVKEGILLAFRAGTTAPYPAGANGETTFQFFDRDTLPLRRTRGVEENVRIVPGGSSVRAGAYLAPGVVVMPPAYVNVGAWIGEGTMVDSHALVGSCAQIGARVHLSAGAQIGGVLEPIGLRPVVIEDEVMVGANTGVFEGVVVGARAGCSMSRLIPAI